MLPGPHAFPRLGKWPGVGGRWRTPKINRRFVRRHTEGARAPLPETPVIWAFCPGMPARSLQPHERVGDELRPTLRVGLRYLVGEDGPRGRVPRAALGEVQH